MARLSALIFCLCAFGLFAPSLYSSDIEPERITDEKQIYDAFWRTFETRDSASKIAAATQPNDSRVARMEGPGAWDLRAFQSLRVNAVCEGKGVVLGRLNWRITSKACGLYELEKPVNVNTMAPNRRRFCCRFARTRGHAASGWASASVGRSRRV